MNEPVKLYAVRSSEGDITVEETTLEELNRDVGDYDMENGEPRWVTAKDLEKNPDPNYWKGTYLLILGRIVVPKPKTRITEYELE